LSHIFERGGGRGLPGRILYIRFRIDGQRQMSEGKAEQASEVKTDKKLDGGAEQVSEGACDGYQKDFLIFEY